MPDGELELEELRLLEPEEEATGWKAESLPEPIRLGRGGAGEDQAAAQARPQDHPHEEGQRGLVESVQDDPDTLESR